MIGGDGAREKEEGMEVNTYQLEFGSTFREEFDEMDVGFCGEVFHSVGF